MDKETIKSILLAHGFTIKPGCDDLRDYVYKAAFELLALAAPAVQGEAVAWQLHTPDGRVILNKEFPAWADGGDGYKITPLYTAPQSAEQQPVSHDWDDQDKCRRCGDRDWYASATCTPKWQPIETAPDREYILILVDGQITGVGSTYPGDWWASMPNGEVCELTEPPTHWMPLPAPPETE